MEALLAAALLPMVLDVVSIAADGLKKRWRTSPSPRTTKLQEKRHVVRIAQSTRLQSQLQIPL